MFAQYSSPDSRLARYDHLIVHVTATPPSQDHDDHSIDQMHRKRGFSGCGYNALIKRDGTWMDSDAGAITRPIGRQGAHVGDCGRGWNGRSFGVTLVGGVDDQLRPSFNMTDAQMATLEKGIQRFLDMHPNGATGVSVMGHRDLIEKTNATRKKACPCFDVIPWWADCLADGRDAGAGVDEDMGGFSSLVDQPAFWTVASGDTLSEIVAVSGVSLKVIMTMNPWIKDPNVITVGQVIRLRDT